MAWLSLCLTFKISANFTYYLEMEDLSFAVFCSNITCGVCIYIPKANNIFLVFFSSWISSRSFSPFYRWSNSWHREEPITGWRLRYMHSCIIFIFFLYFLNELVLSSIVSLDFFADILIPASRLKHADEMKLYELFIIIQFIVWLQIYSRWNRNYG